MSRPAAAAESLGEHAARFMNGGRVGVLQGTKSYLLQDQNGQIALTHSISAGLDYASIGPEHAFLHDADRVEYASVSDDEALEAFQDACGNRRDHSGARVIARRRSRCQDRTRDEPQ